MAVKAMGLAERTGQKISSIHTEADEFLSMGTKHLNNRIFMDESFGATVTFPYCDSIPVQIVGVVKDFNVSGFENNIQPVVYTIGNGACMFQSGGALLVKLEGNDLPHTVAAIEQAWKDIDPDFPIRYSFLDDNFEKLFASYVRLQKVINFFAFTAIAIAVMGLFSLTAFLINQRTKEIGIRKVLGAGIGDLSLLLGKDFMRLILLAVLIAIPIGWWAASTWLQGFAYRIELTGWMFLVAALTLIVIGGLTDRGHTDGQSHLGQSCGIVKERVEIVARI